MVNVTNRETILIIKNILNEYGNDFNYIYKYFNRKEQKSTINLIYGQILKEEADKYSNDMSKDGSDINKILDIYYKEDTIYYKVTHTVNNKEKIIRDYQFKSQNNRFYYLLADYKYTVQMKSHLLKYLSLRGEENFSQKIENEFIENDDLEIVNTEERSDIFSNNEMNESNKIVVEENKSNQKQIKILKEEFIEKKIKPEIQTKKKSVTFADDKNEKIDQKQTNYISYIQRSRE